jgi:hypothetical protein
MRIFAFIENEIVTNLVVAGDADVAEWPYRDTEGQDVRIGWGFVNGVFIAPEPPASSEEPPATDDSGVALQMALEALEAAKVAVEAAIARG